MALDEIFSQENMLAYSGACVNMAVDMAEKRYQKRPFDTLVIPSRGAFPFFLGMTYALDKLRGISDEAARLSDGLAVQPMLAPLMPEVAKVRTDLDKADLRVLLIPFTADLNVPQFDPSLDNDEFVAKTRAYWAHVTAAFFKNPDLRQKDPYFKSFVDVVLRSIEGRGKVADLYEQFPIVRSFGIMDTVISGRASNDILRAFDSIRRCQYDATNSGYEGFVPEAFLILHEDGKKLARNKGFSEYLRQKERMGCANMYAIPNIVSEDTNSSLLGVSALVYPSVMRESRHLECASGREFFVGAGSWFIDPEGLNRSHFRTFMNLVYAGIDAKIAADYYSTLDSASSEVERFNQKRLDFLDLAKKIKILNLGDVYDPSEHTVTYQDTQRPGSYQTHSSVEHVPFSEAYTREIIKQLGKLPGIKVKNPDKT